MKLNIGKPSGINYQRVTFAADVRSLCSSMLAERATTLFDINAANAAPQYEPEQTSVLNARPDTARIPNNEHDLSVLPFPELW